MVERYVKGKPKRKNYPLDRDGDRAAKLYAKTWYNAPTARAGHALTLRDVWEKFYEARCTVPPEKGGLRPRTVQLYKERWLRFELFAKPDTLAEDLTLHTFDLFWNAMVLAGTAPNQVRAIVTAVNVVWRLAQSRDLISNGKPLLFRCPGGEKNKAREIPEYSPTEMERMLAQLRPQNGVRWRIAAVLLFLFDHGFRSNALLHLRWSDAADDPRGALRAPHGEVLARAARLHRSLGLLLGQRNRRSKPWSYQAANLALRAIEEAAKVPHIDGRAFHGPRRTSAKNVSTRTGTR